MAQTTHILIKHNLNFSNLTEFCVEFEKEYGEKIFVTEFTDNYEYFPPIPENYKEWKYTIILAENDTIEDEYNQVCFEIFNIEKEISFQVGKRYIDIFGQFSLLDSWHQVEDLIHIATDKYIYGEEGKLEVLSERKKIFDIMKFYKSDECILFAYLAHDKLYELLTEEDLIFSEAIKKIKTKYYLINYQDLLKTQNLQNYVWDKVIIFDDFKDLKIDKV